VERKYEFNITPTFDEVMGFLQSCEGTISADVETMDGHIVCLGLADSAERAICIPFEYFQGRYWSHEDQEDILDTLRLLCLKNRVWWVGQNWNYDAQYFEEDFGWTKMADFDTYIAQSVLFPGSERGLGYLSSMWCAQHVYWKEDGKEWGKGKKDFNKEFRYNCMDVCRTWEIAQTQRQALDAAGLKEQFRSRMDYSHTVYGMMRRGVNRDPARTEKMIEDVTATIKKREAFVEEAAGVPVNFSSPKQVANLLYKKMGLTPYKGSSTDNDTLTKLIAKYPQSKEVCEAILEARSLTSIKGTFLEAELDPDGRLRSSWMATGTETFRLTSSKNAFHRGGPLQNVTDGKHTNSGRDLPNLRSTIVPDPGYRIFNCDLQRADLQVVVWEADDAELKAMLREGADIHTENAKAIFGLQGTPTEQQRHVAKKFVHLTNYGGKEHTCARGCHITVKDAERMQRRWFQAHPGVLEWHKRTEAALWGTRTVKNRFGYRRVYFDRVAGLLPEALAWGPQSTVSLYISMIQMAWEQALGRRAPILLQVHDSLVGQYLPEHEDEILRIMFRSARIEIPYSDPLIIPLDLATSDSSWGEVEKRSWPI
jgi:DNA polymerase-1